MSLAPAVALSLVLGLVGLHGHPAGWRPGSALVALLQRPRGASLRGFGTRLLELGVIPDVDSEYLYDFLDRYENARFGGRALSATEFDGLMAAFAELLNHMRMDLQKISEFLEDELEDQQDDSVITPSADSNMSFRLSASSEDEGGNIDGDDSNSVLVGYV